METAAERLANAIAFLSNEQLDRVAEILAQDYESRADRLERVLGYALQDKFLQKEVDTAQV